jgi:hypothetical protein
MRSHKFEIEVILTYKRLAVYPTSRGTSGLRHGGITVYFILLVATPGQHIVR